MTPAELKIQQLLNLELEYGIKIITIKGYDIDRGRMKIHTNEKEDHFDYTLEDVPDFLSKFKPLRKVTAVQTSDKDALLIIAANAERLKAILVDSIEKVTKDPNYVKQATVINNNVNTIVNITKTQLDIAKVVNRMK